MPFHIVEVDQSSRFEYTKEATVLAFSDGVRFSILIPAVVKRESIRTLRGQGMTGPTLYTRLFATGLFLLLKDHIHHLPRLTIDVEFQGREHQIKEHLINLLRRYGCDVEADQIQFGLIGKKSGAHSLALETLRGERTPDIVVTGQDILAQFARERK